MAVNLDELIVSFFVNVIVNVIILSPVLWLAGRALVGKEKAKLTDAIWIIVVGTVVGSLFGAMFTGFVAAVIQLILWLLIIKHFFDCGWLKALAITLLAIIIFAAIALILGLIGFALISFVL